VGAIGDPYVTLAQLKDHLGIDSTDSSKDDLLTIALNSACEEINNHCGRQFNRDEAASARKYPAVGERLILVDDFYTETDFQIRVGEIAGSFGSAWSADWYELEPINGVVNGIPGWPFNRISAVHYAPPIYSRFRAEVTARWGWAAVPAPVKEACLLLAAMNWKLQDAPLGVAGFKDFGVTKVKDNPVAVAKLCPYVLGRGKR
jgi:hypothetical protein